MRFVAIFWQCLHLGITRASLADSLGDELNDIATYKPTRPRTCKATRPARETFAIASCTLDSRYCGRTVASKENRDTFLNNPDFEWEIVKWVKSPYNMVENNFFSPKIQSIVDDRFKQLKEESDINSISTAFDRVSPALRFIELRADTIRSSVIVSMYNIQTDYTEFIYHSSKAVLEFFYGSYLVLKKHQRALKTIAWIKPDWSTAEIMNVYKLAIKYLSDSEAYIKSMSRECDNQQKRADKLLKSIIEVGVSTTKEIDSTNKQNAAQNTKHEQELRQKKELQVKIEKNKEDLENARLKYKNKEKLHTELRGKVENITREVISKIADLKPISCDKSLVEDFKDVAKTVAKGVVTMMTPIGGFITGAGCAFGYLDCSEKQCIPTIPQAQIDAITHEKKEIIKQYSNAIDEAMEQKQKLYEEEKLQRKLQIEYAVQMTHTIRLLSSTDLELDRLSMARKGLKFIIGQIREIQKSFSMLKQYFWHWQQIFVQRLEEVEANQETIEVAETTRETEGMEKVWKRTHENIKTEISESAVEWIAIGKLSYFTAKNIDKIRENLHDILQEQNIEKIEKLYLMKNEDYIQDKRKKQANEEQSRREEMKWVAESGMVLVVKVENE